MASSSRRSEAPSAKPGLRKRTSKRTRRSSHCSINKPRNCELPARTSEVERNAKPELLKKYEADVAKAKAENKPAPAQALPDPATNVNRPFGLYNGSIAPAGAVRDSRAIWYQGESNSGTRQGISDALPGDDHRLAKGVGSRRLPVLVRADRSAQRHVAGDSGRSTADVQTTQNTAMAVTLDVGDAADIHPKAKQPVGARLALAARALAHGDEKNRVLRPGLRSLSVSGNKATSTSNISAADWPRRMEHSKASRSPAPTASSSKPMLRLTVNDRRLTSDAVSAPTAVRYGWSTCQRRASGTKPACPRRRSKPTVRSYWSRVSRCCSTAPT